MMLHIDPTYLKAVSNETNRTMFRINAQTDGQWQIIDCRLGYGDPNRFRLRNEATAREWFKLQTFAAVLADFG